jgi:hypothetical protein
MKLFIYLVLAGAVISWNPCRAEDGSTQGEKKSDSPTFVGPGQNEVAVHARKIRHIYSTDGKHWAFCRDSYCLRAKRCPWFPAAPGD